MDDDDGSIQLNLSSFGSHKLESKKRKHGFESKVTSSQLILKLHQGQGYVFLLADQGVVQPGCGLTVFIGGSKRKLVIWSFDPRSKGS